MPSAARAWQNTVSTFLAKEGCATVGFGKSMRTITIDGVCILLGAYFDFSVIAYANWQVLDTVRARLLDAFKGTYTGALQLFFGCEVVLDIDKGTAYLC